MAVADTAPVESDGPRAVTHSPTARAEAVAAFCWNTVVVEVVVTVMSAAAGVVVVVVLLPELERRKLKPLRSVPWTTTPDALTDCTVPTTLAI